MIYFAVLGTIIFALATIFVINIMYNKGINEAQVKILNALPHGVLVVNNKATVVYLNAFMLQLLNSTSQNVLGKHIDTILSLRTNDKTVLYDQYSLDETLPKDTVYQLFQADEQYLPISLTLSPITFESDTDSRLLLIENISGKKQLEEMKVDFVSMAAHELRTPLTAIRGYASVLQMHYSTNLENQAKDLLTKLLMSTANLANLIDNLLIVSRIEKNDMAIERQPINITLILNDIFESFKQQANTKKLTFILNLPKEEIPQVMVDPFKIGQVFINLISNALKYTNEKGTVAVTVQTSQRFVEIIVQDTGRGIPKESLPMLFTKFYRVASELNQGPNSTGLGLYITKSIVDLHGGHLEVESILGKGSKFTCSLPIATQEMISAQKQKTDNAFLTAKNGQAIIVKKTYNNASDTKGAA